MSEIQLYAAFAVATAGVCWYLNRRNQSRASSRWRPRPRDFSG